ncbi:hypothetical protein ACH4VR_31030 [Streptomyces sp. NPDC020883]|uniref:hypothetical protein n=1 Tax=Streptomyces sp. NPDC020883 TaxID=3365099 RepID=UPI0037997499
MSRYLEEAADLLRKAANAHERKYADGRWVDAAIEGRVQIAQQFATLAAIDKGLLPAEAVQDVLRALGDRNAA